MSRPEEVVAERAAVGPEQGLAGRPLETNSLEIETVS